MESWYCSVTDSILLTLSVLYSPLLCLKLLVPPEIWRRTLCRRLKGGMLGFKSRQKIRRIGILMASDLLCLMNYIFVALVGDAELSFPRAHVLIFEPSWHFHLSLNVPAIHKKICSKSFNTQLLSLLLSDAPLLLISKVFTVPWRSLDLQQDNKSVISRETAPKLYHILWTIKKLKSTLPEQLSHEPTTNCVPECLRRSSALEPHAAGVWTPAAPPAVQKEGGGGGLFCGLHPPSERCYNSATQCSLCPSRGGVGYSGHLRHSGTPD